MKRSKVIGSMSISVLGSAYGLFLGVLWVSVPFARPLLWRIIQKARESAGGCDCGRRAERLAERWSE